jgi:hypothetical protein
MFREFVLPLFEKKFIEISPESKDLLFSDENRDKRKKTFVSKKREISTTILKLESSLMDCIKEN